MERLTFVNLEPLTITPLTIPPPTIPPPTALDAAGENWADDRARCADGNGSLTFLFFSDDPVEIERARTVCRRCTRRADCFGVALARREVYGVWGGELFVDGVPMALRPTRGRPPKIPRIPPVVDEVPVPPHLLDGTLVA